MTATERAIQDAMKGGYFPPYTFSSFTFGTDGSIGQNNREIAGVLLDPKCWEAVGKVRGWDNGNYKSESYKSASVERWMWQHLMLGLIDALCEGKTIEKYLLSIETTV